MFLNSKVTTYIVKHVWHRHLLMNIVCTHLWKLHYSTEQTEKTLPTINAILQSSAFVLWSFQSISICSLLYPYAPFYISMLPIHIHMFPSISICSLLPIWSHRKNKALLHKPNLAQLHMETPVIYAHWFASIMHISYLLFSHIMYMASIFTPH